MWTNQEVYNEFENAIEDGGWQELADSLRESEDLLEATLRGDAEAVAECIIEKQVKKVKREKRGKQP